MFFPGPLAVLMKMLMGLYCACIYFHNHNAEGKSIKLKCCFCRREEYLLSCSTKDRSGLPAKHWFQILNSRYCTHGMALVREELRACNFHLILQSLDPTWMNANTGKFLSIPKGTFPPSHKAQQFLCTTKFIMHLSFPEPCKR